MGKAGIKRYPYEPDYAVPPGESLKETIEALGMKQRDLAARTGMATKTINQIIKGKAPITPDTAILFERVTGVPARMWNNLESNYREQLAKISDRQRLEDDLGWLKTIPVKEIVKRGYIGITEDKKSLVYSVLQFFAVASSKQWNHLWLNPEGAYRKSPKFQAEPGAVATWLRIGEIEAQKIESEPYDKSRFESSLMEIRELTVEPPHLFQNRMIELSAAAGVAVVFVPEMKKCPTSGVARWLSPTKALIQLTLRHKTDDHFWFSFFHEAGHILKDPKKEVFIHNDNGDDDREEKANKFSADFLIPPEQFPILQGLQTEAEIVAFSKSIGIAPGIVLGRLQKEGLIPWRTNLNRLKRRFVWSAN